MMALTSPVIIIAAGLGVETGYWYLLAERAQKAADMSAHLGAVALRGGAAPGQATALAAAEAGAYGYVAPAATVGAFAPPATGAHIDDRSVEVRIAFQTQRFLSAMIDPEPVPMSVRAVAAFDEPADACLLALDIEASEALTFTGSSNISLIACEVMSNSIAPDAVSITGSSDLETDCVNSVGGVVVSGVGADLLLTACAAPREDLPRAPDPYEDVPAPSTSQPCESLPAAVNGLVSVSPGIDGIMRICDGLTLKEDTHFAPGVYVIDGMGKKNASFTINASTVVTGDAVTFYLTGGVAIGFNGNAEIDLTAPTTGPYAGIVFMGDRDDTAVIHKFNGTADSRITGAIYTPASKLEFLGNFSGDDGCMQLVAGKIDLSGNVSINTDCTGTGIVWGDVPGRVRLVE